MLAEAAWVWTGNSAALGHSLEVYMENPGLVQ